jgi:16S rRNA (uracil1498-N3)-methyltransferase
LPDRVEALILSSSQSDTEPPYIVTLYQALPKGDKLDTVIQKAVECGASEIVTFVSERCIAKESSREENKLARRQRISLEAAKQSGRGIIPPVMPTVSFAEMLNMASAADISLICYEGDVTVSLKGALSSAKAEGLPERPRISVVIGSEGGFSLKEIDEAREAGLIPVGLGKRILRTETAPSVALSALIYEFEL